MIQLCPFQQTINKLIKLFLFTCLFYGIISCNIKPSIKEKLENCSSLFKKDYIVVIVPLKSQIRKISINGVNIKKLNNPSLDISFDFKIKRGDQVELFWNSFNYKIYNFKFKYSFLFISNISSSTILLDYRCSEIVID